MYTHFLFIDRFHVLANLCKFSCCVHSRESRDRTLFPPRRYLCIRHLAIHVTFFDFESNFYERVVNRK